MDYPSDFPQTLKDAFELARLAAKRSVNAARGKPDFEDCLKDFISTAFFAFADETCELVREGTWTLDRTRRTTDEFLNALIKTEYLDNHRNANGRTVLGAFEYFKPGLIAKIKTSPEWQAYEDGLVAASKEREKQHRNAARSTDNMGPGDRKSALPDAQRPPNLGKKTRNFREPNLDLLKNLDTTLNRAKAAEALGVSERTLDRIPDNELVPVGVGSRKRFRTKDLLRLLQRKHRDKVDKTGQE